MTIEEAFAAADHLADTTFAGWKVPGVAYGIVRDGELVHSRGLGTTQVGRSVVPGADSVFRIASMTKSFTAATVLLLRDDGLLRLDDPVADHVPELANLRGPTTDSPAITIRHLLTMTAGFPTDDPWGDRQQGLDLEQFAELLRGGISFAWAPGVRFEYSNLGYGILGRVITNVAGQEYREVVRDRLLTPLGMAATTYLESEVPSDRLVHGYHWADEQWTEEPRDPYGALASMGGLFTTVRDLARWVGEFTDAFPPRDDPETGHPLRRASRREMQQPHRPFGPAVTLRSPDAAPELDGAGYGFGLTAVDHLQYGRIVTHSGGYPGFGSDLRWHAASGYGVIVLANGRYAPARRLSQEMLDGLLGSGVPRSRRIEPAAATASARTTVEALLARWDGDAAAALFAMNVELDQPIAKRRALMEGIREVHGVLRPDPDEPPESLSPFDLTWWMRGERGRVKVEIQLSPEARPLVQALTLTSVPEPSQLLRSAAERVVAALQAIDGAMPRWPAELEVASDVDREALDRACRATEARFGTVKLGPAIAGDGVKTATFRLECTRGRVDLRLDRDPDSGTFNKVSLVPVPLETPLFAD
jgi:CubicO group peptidase (beta-lactamase class C family)